MKRLRPLLVLACAAAAGWLGCGGDVRPKNVLLVTIDTLRADRLGCYGHAAAATPHLDALAARGLRFENASTVVPLTLPAHSSLLTGTFPAYHGVRDNGGFYLGEEARTLAEVLAEEGLRTGGFVGAFVLDSRWGVAQGFERYFDDFDLTKYETPGMDAIQRPGSEVTQPALAWLAEDAERPFFAWVHLYDPHTPYEAPEPFRGRFPATRGGAYDAEIAWTDSLVGRLVESLEKDGRLDDTLVVVAGDHGEMLGEHEELTHGFFIYEAAVRIPLLVAGPGIPAAEVAAPVRIVDVFPTVLARLGIEAPAAVQGVDLLPLAEGGKLELLAHSESWYPRYHYGWSELQSIREGRYKLIRAPRRELYDLVADPGERTNLASAEPRRVNALEHKLERLLAQVTAETAPSGPQAVDPETAERLAALGYLGGSTSARHLEERPRGDPKDKIGLYNLLKQATSASATGRLDEAIAKVDEALAEDAEIVEAHMLRGNFLKKAERLDESVAAYRAALDLDPEHRQALFTLAVAYKDLGRLDDALAGFERAVSLDERDGKALWQIADVHMRQERFEDAERRIFAALELDLDRPRFLLKLGECYFEMKRYDDAERRLLEALAANPELGSAHFTLGLVHEDRGRTAAAIAAYEKALEHNPEGYRASFNLAKLLLAGGRPGEAVGFFQKTVEIRPQLGTGHLYLAKALLDTGDLEGAEAAARRGLERSPEPRLRPLGHLVLADVYNRLGRFAEASREEAEARRLALAASDPNHRGE